MCVSASLIDKDNMGLLTSYAGYGSAALCLWTSRKAADRRASPLLKTGSVITSEFFRI